jgi:hypothetical protein
MKFRKKPVVIDAVKFNGTVSMAEWPQEFVRACRLSPEATEAGVKAIYYIDTLEGRMKLERGDWLIKGVKGEFYPCKPDIFEMTYEPAPASEGEKQ